MANALRTCLLLVLLTFVGADVFVSEEEVVNEPVVPSGTPIAYEKGNANDYLDQLLGNLGPTIAEKRLDPLALPNIKKGFEKMVGLIKIHGGFQVTQNRLRGLKSLHRAGDATLLFEDNTMKIHATLGIKDLHISGKARAWWGAIRHDFPVAGTVDYLSATISLEMPMSDGGKPAATSLVINTIGKITVNVENLGGLNWVVNGLGSLILNMVKGILKSKITPPLLKLINGTLDKLPIFGLYMK